MAVCLRCGRQMDQGFPFCPWCGARIVAERALPEERKTISVLMSDLVDFTGHSERSDAEDIDRLVRRFAAVVHEVVAVHGGVTEKSVGDAVLAVFGVPVAHDDDATRAVAAGFELVGRIGELSWPGGEPVVMHAGVTTGEALVRLTVAPESGESFVVGDVVNTASRLQAAAPPGTVLVAEPAYQLSARAIEYRKFGPVSLRGKAEPVPAWLVVARKTGATSGSSVASAGGFIGRRAELETLHEALAGVEAARRSQFRLVVGEPGIGKTRLLTEFGRRLAESSRSARLLQGVCRPFGTDVAFSALEDIVRAHAGILPTDDAATIAARLDAAVAAAQDRDWVRERCALLVGLEAAPAGRDEDFAAWRAHLVGMASDGPLVLVFEDVHWADEATLAFLSGLAEAPLQAPVLVLASARPEFLGRPGGQLAGEGGTARLHLDPLTDQETKQLLATLLDGPRSDTDAIVLHAGGNPLYAEAYARLLVDREQLLPGDGRGVELPPLPGSLQAVIAARLDTLPPGHKAVVQDASVLGQVFWLMGLAAVGGRTPDEVEIVLEKLADRQLIRATDMSEIPGEREYAFSHSLTAEVAYAEIPRAVRARKHATAAEWLRSLAGVRPDDRAEALAHHYSTAHELAASAGAQALAAELVDPALKYLMLTARRGMVLDVASAVRDHQRALALAPADSPLRAELLLGCGQALASMSRYHEASEVLAEAVRTAEAAGRLRVAAVASAYLCVALAFLTVPGHYEAIQAARGMLQKDGPSAERAQVLWIFAGYHCNVLAAWQTALQAADESVAMAAALGLDPPMGALGYRGMARCRLGDPGGRYDVRQALEMGADTSIGERLIVEGAHLDCLYWNEGPALALNETREALNDAERRGVQAIVSEHRVSIVRYLTQCGDWKAAAMQANELGEFFEVTEDPWQLIPLRVCQVLLNARRGSTAAALEHAIWLRAVGAEMPIQPMRSNCLLSAALAHAFAGADAVAAEVVDEWAVGWDGLDPSHVELVTDVVRSVPACRSSAWVERPLGDVRLDLPIYRNVVATVTAIRAEDGGDLARAEAAYETARTYWADFGVPYEEAHAALGRGRCLVALGRVQEAAPLVARAEEVFASLGAVPALEQVRGLLRGWQAEGIGI